jgi:antitoxin component YwqK of YwqJK toxin-antitoxin module
MTFRRVASAILVSYFIYIPAFSQDIIFFEYITEDSARLFFNRRNHFTSIECADYFRFAKLDAAGVYNGNFKDVDKREQVLGKGNYLNGTKDGAFEIYHGNGRVKETRLYKDGAPTGEWHSYYDNGLPERTLKFSGSDTLLLRFIDKKGNVLVSNGEGEFHGTVAGFDGKSKGEIIASGKIINGKPHGKWSSTFLNMPYCKEEFNNGKLVQGIFPNAKYVRKYYSGSHLNTFVLQDYIQSLEKLRMEDCNDSTFYLKPEDLKFDFAEFCSDLGEKIRGPLNKELGDALIWNNVTSIEFSINNEGKPENFNRVTSWGQAYYYSIINALKRYGQFDPTNKKLYFIMRITKSEARSMNIHYKISRRPEGLKPQSATP